MSSPHEFSASAPVAAPVSDRIFPPLTPAIIAAIRADAITGYSTREIAERHGFPEQDMEIFLRSRRPRWLAERRQPFEIRRNKIVLFRPRSRRDGGFDIRPFSVPRISMHVAALTEARS